MNKRTALSVSALLALVALSGCIGGGGQVREITMWVEQTDWNIHPNVNTTTWAFCAEGDGVEPVWDGACGVPGPTIHVTKGDTIRLTFKNTHTIPHTVHFHGWHPFMTDMSGNSLIDGAMVVSPGSEAVIEWVAEPAGSFIYHCHFDTPTHMEMGMYGAFIVDDPKESSPPDQDFVAVLDEWSIHDEPQFTGAMPDYNYFTINGKSFPQTQIWMVGPGENIRIHMVNAGYKFHAMHLHGYTPDSWEGVAGPDYAVPTDVREIAPGQTVVLDFKAEREGVWLFHDHVVPHATAAADGSGFGAYPRGMLTALVVGDQWQEKVHEILPELLQAAQGDVAAEPHEHGEAAEDSHGGSTQGTVVAMKDFAFAETELRVSAGSTVTWENQDSAVHTVTDDAGSFDSGNIKAGASWSHKFTEPGTYTYHCTPHAYQDDGEWKGMVATVIVE